MRVLDASRLFGFVVGSDEDSAALFGIGFECVRDHAGEDGLGNQERHFDGFSCVGSRNGSALWQ